MGRKLGDDAVETEIRKNGQCGNTYKCEPKSLVFRGKEQRNEKQNDRTIYETPELRSNRKENLAAYEFQNITLKSGGDPDVICNADRRNDITRVDGQQ